MKIIKIDNKNCGENEIFTNEIDFINSANEYYHEHCINDFDYEENFNITTFDEAKELFKIEDYKIEVKNE